MPAGARVVSIGPVTSATAREHGLEPCTWRPSATTSTAWSTALVADARRDDRHPAHRLRPRRRLRRRLPRRDPRASHPEAQIVDITHGIPRYAVRQGALVLRNTLPYMPVGRARGGRRPAGGHRAPRASRCACGDGRLLVGPDNGLLSLAWERCGGVELAVDITPLAAPARAGVGHLPRPRRVRPGGGPARRGRRAGRRRRPARPRRRSSAVELPEPRQRGRRAGGARAGGRPLRQRRPERGPRRPGRHRPHARRPRWRSRPAGERYLGHLRADVRRRAARASCSSTRTPTARSPWRSTAATPPRRSASQPDAEVRLRPR